MPWGGGILETIARHRILELVQSQNRLHLIDMTDQCVHFKRRELRPQADQVVVIERAAGSRVDYRRAVVVAVQGAERDRAAVVGVVAVAPGKLCAAPTPKAAY